MKTEIIQAEQQAVKRESDPKR